MYTIRRISKRLRIFLLISCVLLLALAVIDVTGFGRDFLAVSVPLAEDSDVARAAFLAEYGWEISTVPTEVCDVVIPERFNQTYERYNALQQTQGFDLADYKGKRAKRYTYRVLNHPSGDAVQANLLVLNGQVIGGDLCTLAPDGFMQGFDGTQGDFAYQTAEGDGM